MRSHGELETNKVVLGRVFEIAGILVDSRWSVQHFVFTTLNWPCFL